MSTCATPEWMLRELADAVDASPIGRKGLAGRLGVSPAAVSYWLTGREQFPLLRLRQAAEALGPEHGRRLLEAALGEGWEISAAVEAPSVEDFGRTTADQVAAEGRFLDELHRALKDGHVSRPELDRIVRQARDARALIAALEAAARRKAAADGGAGA